MGELCPCPNCHRGGGPAGLFAAAVVAVLAAAAISAAAAVIHTVIWAVFAAVYAAAAAGIAALVCLFRAQARTRARWHITQARLPVRAQAQLRAPAGGWGIVSHPPVNALSTLPYRAVPQASRGVTPLTAAVDSTGVTAAQVAAVIAAAGLDLTAWQEQILEHIYRRT